MASSRIKGITIELNGDTTKLTDAIKKAEREINNASRSMRDIDKLLKLDPKNTELLTQKQKALTDAIEATKDKLSQEKEALEQLKNGPQTEQTIAQQEALSREIVDTEQHLRSLENEYKQFGSVAQQQAKVAADAMKATGEKIQKAGQGMYDVGSTLTRNVTAPIVAGSAVAIKSYAEVDKTMTLANKTMNNSAEEAKALNDAMKQAAMNSTFGMSDAASAALNFARAGLDASEAAAAMAPAMNLAAGEGGNLDTVSAGLVATINGFNGSFEESARYADVFANACNNSALDVDSLANSMSIAAPVFKSAGYSVEDVAVYMGAMADGGIEANVAANALKTGLARLVSPAKQGKVWLEKLGISVTNADGSMKDSVTVQSELHDAFSKLSESEQLAAASAIFGKNQMANWLTLIGTAPGRIDELNGKVRQVGTTSEMADAMMSGFGGSLEKLKSSTDVAVESFGEALAPTISKLAESLQSAVDWFNSLDDSQKEAIAKAAMVVAAIGPILMVVGKLTIGVGKLVSAVGTLKGAFAAGGIFSGVTKAAGAASAAVGKAASSIASGAASAASAAGSFITADVGATVAAGGAAAGATIGTAIAGGAVAAVGGAEAGKKIGEALFPDDAELYQEYEGISGTFALLGETVTTLGERTAEHARNIWGSVTEAAGLLRERTGEHLLAFEQSTVTATDNVALAWQLLKERTAEHWAEIQASTNEAWEMTKQSVSEKANGIKDEVVNAWQNMKTSVQGVIDSAKQWGTDLMNNIRSGIEAGKARVQSAIESVGASIRARLHFSEPDVGPLSDFNSWMPDMMNQMAQQITAGIPGVTGAIQNVAGNMAAGMKQVDYSAQLAGINQSVQGLNMSGNIVVPVYIGNTKMGQAVATANQLNTYRSGGR